MVNEFLSPVIDPAKTYKTGRISYKKNQGPENYRVGNKFFIKNRTLIGNENTYENVRQDKEYE